MNTNTLKFLEDINRELYLYKYFVFHGTFLGDFITSYGIRQFIATDKKPGILPWYESNPK